MRTWLRRISGLFHISPLPKETPFPTFEKFYLSCLRSWRFQVNSRCSRLKHNHAVLTSMHINSNNLGVCLQPFFDPYIVLCTLRLLYSTRSITDLFSPLSYRHATVPHTTLSHPKGSIAVLMSSLSIFGTLSTLNANCTHSERHHKSNS